MSARHWIGGAAQDSADGRTLLNVAPATGAPLGPIARGGAPEVEAAVRAAAAVQPEWAARPLEQRAAVLVV